MLRAKTSDGKYIMGLDAENIRRLKAGQPILIDLRIMEGTDVVTLMYGETLEDLTRDLEKLNGGPLPVNPWPGMQ